MSEFWLGFLVGGATVVAALVAVIVSVIVSPPRFGPWS